MINPILERELKTRVRSWKTAWLISGYLLIIGIVVALAFLAESSSYRYGVSGFDPTVVTGIYVAITLFQLGLLTTILPVFTATSISGERERQTLDLLLCTDISPWKIIFGKMSAALSFVMLLIVAGLPFTGIVLLFGGVNLFDIFKIVMFYLATAIMVSSIGMYTTIRFKKNITSIVMSYVILGLVFILPLIFLFILMIFANNLAYDHNFVLFIEDHAYEFFTILFASNPFYGMASIVVTSSFGTILYYMFDIPVNASSSFIRFIEPWMACLIFYTIFTTIMLLLARKRLTKLK